MRLTKNAAQHIEHAARELHLSESAQEGFIEDAARYAQLDYCDEIHARHMLHSLGQRQMVDGEYISGGQFNERRIM